MLLPMLASLLDAPLTDPDFVYEPKYDGIRAIAEVSSPSTRPRSGSTANNAQVRLWSRLGNEKTSQFPEIADALGKWGRRLKEPLVLDGEIVALDAKGNPAGFQNLQGRIHVAEKRPEQENSPFFPGRVAFIAFDLLREGRSDFRDRPLLERRGELERIFGETGSPILRISEMVRGDARALYRRAVESGWEGLIAKHVASVYKSGKRTPDWRKLKIVHEQEFVIAGWTEPRHTRVYFGALLLGFYRNGQLVYAGHTGTGFNQRELERLWKLLKPLEIDACPFHERPKTNERPHWVHPKLVAQIKFTEWTADGKLRHPVYVGLRDDKKPEQVRREVQTRLHATSEVRLKGDSSGETLVASGFSRTSDGPSSRTPKGATSHDALIDQLTAIEASHRDGVLTLEDGKHLKVTNLHKVFWPKQKVTKGRLMRYYVQVAPFLLPAVADRSLVMKRYPNGVGGQAFYQHRVEKVPDGVRVETVTVAETRRQIVGGNLITLLYMTQLAAISQDPWFSRVTSPEHADYVALDLDPMPGVPFARVLDVARWIRDELDALDATGVPKTSGADGLHVYIPLPPHTPYGAGLLFCQIIATVVSQKHPKVATIERSVKARGRRVYVDYLQNISGKTLATAYSARASEHAGVSTPLTWSEVDEGVDPKTYTIDTASARVRQVGDLWEALRRSRGVDLSRVTRYAKRRQ